MFRKKCHCRLEVHGFKIIFVPVARIWLSSKSFVPFQWKKAEEKLERELLEAEASENTEKKLKLVSTFFIHFTFGGVCVLLYCTRSRTGLGKVFLPNSFSSVAHQKYRIQVDVGATYRDLKPDIIRSSPCLMTPIGASNFVTEHCRH